ncbi:hypothetical protein KKF84_07855 [Myxococcota bacterium]|nr:hypothetical protein [Myxococcota bacterium]MBU1535220.1 hypothetical protein [Myxococcota bacterium]
MYLSYISMRGGQFKTELQRVKSVEFTWMHTILKLDNRKKVSLPIELGAQNRRALEKLIAGV